MSRKSVSEVMKPEVSLKKEVSMLVLRGKPTLASMDRENAIRYNRSIAQNAYCNITILYFMAGFAFGFVRKTMHGDWFPSDRDHKISKSCICCEIRIKVESKNFSCNL